MKYMTFQIYVIVKLRLDDDGHPYNDDPYTNNGDYFIKGIIFVPVVSR